MGVLSKLVLAPLAPVTGVIWLAEQLERQAAELYYSPDAIRAQLRELQAMYEHGEIDDNVLEEQETQLLARLSEVDHG